MRRSPFISILLLAAISCSQDYISVGRPQLVVEGWIEEGAFPMVIVTQTVPVSTDRKTSDSLSEYVIVDADVTVSDGVNVSHLYCGKDDNYFPNRVYKAFDFRGEAGKSYTLTVRYAGECVTGVTTIPASCPLDSLVTHLEPGDTAYSLTAHFTRGDETPDDVCYRFFTKLEGTDKRFLPSFLGTVDSRSITDRDAGAPGIQASLPLYRGVTVPFSDIDFHWYAGQTVQVKFCTMERSIWSWWNSYDSVTAFSTNPLFPVSVNACSNISGGIGYWAGYGTTVASVTFPELPL